MNQLHYPFKSLGLVKTAFIWSSYSNNAEQYYKLKYMLIFFY